MTTLYWQIAPELEQLRRQAERMLEDRGQAPVAPPAWKPAAELQDLGDRYELQLQLPGVDRGALDIQATQDSVIVKGDRPAPEKRPDKGADKGSDNQPDSKLIHSEFRHGAFERNIRLPEAVQHQAIVAHYDQGLLKLTLPKLTAAPNYRVQVAVNAGNSGVESAAQAPDTSQSRVPVASEVSSETAEQESAIAQEEDVWADQSV